MNSELVLPAPAGPVDMRVGSIYFIGNATVLLRCAGFTILTDPTFIHMHEQTWLGYGLHTTRLTNPAINLDDLPPVDLVVLSHFHGDHFDQLVEARLDKTLPIVTNPSAAKDLERRGFTATYPVDTWSTLVVSKGDAAVRVTAMPGRHGPPVVSFALPEVMGSMLDFETRVGTRLLRLYITGDTLMIDDLKEIPRRYPGIDIGLFHLGGTEVLGVTLTMDARQGVEAVSTIQPDVAIPIHFDDYDVFKSPLSDFQREVEAAGLRDKVHYLAHGDMFTFTVPAGPARDQHPINQPDTQQPGA